MANHGRSIELPSPLTHDANTGTKFASDDHISSSLCSNDSYDDLSTIPTNCNSNELDLFNSSGTSVSAKLPLPEQKGYDTAYIINRLCDLVEYQDKQLHMLAPSTLLPVISKNDDVSTANEDARNPLPTMSGTLQHETLYQNKSSAQLNLVGARCLGEGHKRLIQQQKETIKDLRHTCQQLDLNRPRFTNTDQLLARVQPLTEQLQKLTESQLCSEARARDDVCKPHYMTPNMLLKSYQYLDTARTELSNEKESHAQTQFLLEKMSGAYHHLLYSLKTMLNISELNNIENVHSLELTFTQGRMSREKIEDIVYTKIQSLQEKLVNKDEVMREYEENLKNMKKFEEELNVLIKENSSLHEDLECSKQEADYLRYAMIRCKEQLEYEQSLNKAIKSRKIEFKGEKQSR